LVVDDLQRERGTIAYPFALRREASRRYFWQAALCG